MVFKIKDWTGREMFDNAEFDTFEDAEEFLAIMLGDEYDEERGEFYIINPIN
jgi:hypothetical protein